MKTISGNCVSSKQISLPKAAKILSKFVSADNGASQVTNAYLHRASAAFDELNQIHKELKLPHSYKKRKGHKTEKTHDDSGKVVENSVRSFEINQDLNHGYFQPKNEFSRQQLGSENADEDGEKSTLPVIKLSPEFNGSIGYDVGNGRNEKHKSKKREIESMHDGNNNVKLREGEGEEKLSINVQNDIVSGREHDNECDGNMGMEEGKKRKKKEGDKSIVQNGSESGQDQGNEGDGNMGMEKGKKLKKDKKHKEGTGDMTKKRMKRKHEDDP